MSAGQGDGVTATVMARATVPGAVTETMTGAGRIARNAARTVGKNAGRTASRSERSVERNASRSEKNAARTANKSPGRRRVEESPGSTSSGLFAGTWMAPPPA